MKSFSVKPLSIAELCARCEPASLPGESTADLPDGDGLTGQERAIEAISFGARIERAGYNIFCLCDPQSGAIESVGAFLRDLARDGLTPPDWLYVQNYADPRRPKAIALPAGRGRALRDNLTRIVRELKSTIPGIFESDEYQTRSRALHGTMEASLQSVYDRAEAQGLLLVTGDDGVTFVPARNGRKMRKVEIEQLAPAERRRLDQRADELERELGEVVRQIPKWEADAREGLRALNYEFMLSEIERALKPVRDAFRQYEPVAKFIEEVTRDMIENVHLFVDQSDGEVPIKAGSWTIQPADPLERYAVNLIVDNAEQHGRPVLVEHQPTYTRLVGRMDQTADLGSIHSDFSMLRGGALHQANGGFLLIDAETLLEYPAAWEALKTALKSGFIAIDTLREFLGDSDTGTVMPDAIPLTAKIVLFGDWFLHQALGVHDPEFPKLFRVQADFADSMPRTRENEQRFARLIATLQRRNKLRPFDRSATARMIDESARKAEDSKRLSLRLEPLGEIMTEADFWAGQNGHSYVTAGDIDEAIRSHTRRRDLYKEMSSEFILRDYRRIETDGMKVGQVNGLVVTGTDLAFGLPTRITARARLGSASNEAGQVVDIQRQIGKGGPYHSKGVLVLSGYLRGRYLPNEPLALAATLAFEQTYNSVDGDSASVAEMCALLSAIAGLPLRQSLALTGAISQLGEVQAIGGVNEKIEGFFDICEARGFAKGQGVIIPRTNLPDLMLRRDVVEAANRGEFAIYAVETVDQVMEMLTGLRAGRRGLGGKFGGGTINRRVEDRLRAFSQASFGPRASWF